MEQAAGVGVGHGAPVPPFDGCFSAVPNGTNVALPPDVPALKCWAIFRRAYGTNPPPSLHELSPLFERADVRFSQFEPLTVPSLRLESFVPIRFDARRIVSLDRMNRDG